MRPRKSAPEAPVEAARSIEADLSGAVISGQVAVGEHIVQIHAEHGAVVNYVAPAERPVARLRPPPVRHLPRDFPALLGRDETVAAVKSALVSGSPVELCGEAGIGKTALIRHLAHRLPESATEEGLVYTVCRRKPADDILQFLFESFYESHAELVATPAELVRYLGGRRALLVLDDVELERDELERLMDTAPGCLFLTASTTRGRWGEGLSLELSGLEPDAALQLIERELGRSLTTEERPAVESLCRSAQGHPLRLLQGAALLREGGHALPLEQHPEAASSDQTAAAVFASLSEPERRVLKPLLALPGVPLHADHLAAVTGEPGAPGALSSLAERALVEAHSPRYSLAGAPGHDVMTEGDAERWRDSTLSYLADWVEDQKRGSTRLLEELEAISALLEWGSERGRWPEVLRLARGTEATVALAGRFGAWRTTLERALQAARALGDRKSEGWALHQLGSRALCLGDAPAAQAILAEALELRESLGDEDGARLTRHNLGLLSTAPPPARRSRRRLPPLALLLGLVFIAGGAGTGMLLLQEADQPGRSGVAPAGPRGDGARPRPERSGVSTSGRERRREQGEPASGAHRGSGAERTRHRSSVVAERPRLRPAPGPPVAPVPPTVTPPDEPPPGDRNTPTLDAYAGPAGQILGAVGGRCTGETGEAGPQRGTVRGGAQREMAGGGLCARAPSRRALGAAAEEGGALAFSGLELALFALAGGGLLATGALMRGVAREGAPSPD